MSDATPCAHCDRRTFLQLSLAAAALAACGGDSPTAPVVDTPDVSFAVNGDTVTIDLPRSPALSRDGAAIIGTAAVIVVRSGGLFRAFSNVCTHAGCGVSDVLDTSVRCRCHGSRFGFDGRVVEGPASVPLRTLTLARSGDTLVIQRG